VPEPRKLRMRAKLSRSLWACGWSQVDLKAALLHVQRRKNGTPAVHPLTGRELRALRRLHREAEGSPFVFNTERGSGMTTDNVQGARSSRAGRAPGSPRPSAHAAPCLRLHARHQGDRHAHHSGVPRAPLDPAHGEVHGACAGTL